MRVLVTGSSGFIGSHLTQLLANRGHQVAGYDKREPDGDFGVDEHITGNILDKQLLTRSLKSIDVVVHLAAIHFDYGHEPEEYWEGNETGTQRVLESMDEAGVDKIVFTSTIAIYGDSLDRASEETEPNPTSPYGASKMAAERLLHNWVATQSGRSATILRPCAVYGERNITNMNNLIRQIDSGFFILFGRGGNIKAIAYVGNVIEALTYFVENTGPNLRTYNYCDEPDATVLDIVQNIRTGLGKSEHVMRCPLWLGNLAALPFDVATSLTGWNLPVSRARVNKLALPTMIDATRIREAGVRQKWTLEEGMQRTVREFLQRNK